MNKLRHKLERHWPNQLKQSTDGAAREKRDNATATSGRWGETTRQVQDDVSTQQQNKNQIQTKQQQQKKRQKKVLSKDVLQGLPLLLSGGDVPYFFGFLI